MRRSSKLRLTLRQAMASIAVLGLFLGVLASFRQYPELILLIVGWGAGYWVILVLPFVLREAFAKRKAAKSGGTRPTNPA